MNDGKLLARIRDDQRHGRWVEIRLFRKRCIRCSCGAHVDDKPQIADPPPTLIKCQHLIALYVGKVTSDKRQFKYEPSTYECGLIGPVYQSRLPLHAQLTELGREMFEWRWAARALAHS